MAKLLYITANPKAVAESFSLTVGQEFLESYREAFPEDRIVPLDLYDADIPLIDPDVFAGWGKLRQGMAYEHLSDEEKRKVGRINELTDQFVEADKYVFVTPMWNFSFPPKVKAFIDTICIAGRTFKYTDEGSVGLLTDKLAVHIQARGGIYSEGPARDMEFGDRYWKAVMNFLGVPYIESIIAEGMAAMPNEAESIKNRAIEKAREAAKTFTRQAANV